MQVFSSRPLRRGGKIIPFVVVAFIASMLFRGFRAEGQTAETQDASIDYIQSGVWVNEEGEQVFPREEADKLCLKENVTLSDIEFGVGTIDFDISFEEVGKGPGFVGLHFHVGADDNFERVYFRPMNSGKETAVQYDPIFNGYSNWQLYNAPSYEGSANLSRHPQWTHVRLSVSNESLMVFVEDMSTPVLNVSLKAKNRGERNGAIRLDARARRGFPSNWIARFANLTITHGDADAPDNPSPRSESVENEDLFLTSFKMAGTGISNNRPVAEQVREIPDTDWQNVVTDPRHDPSPVLLNLNRFVFDRPAEKRATAVLRASIDSEKEQRKQLHFDYAEICSIHLNGEELYSGKSWEKGQDWRVIDGEYSVELPLIQGTNDLVFVMGSRNFGWGLMARLEDKAGITLPMQDGEKTRNANSDRGEGRKLLYTTGHGEWKVKKRLVKVVEEIGLEFDTLDEPITADALKNVDMLYILVPTQPFTREEKAAVINFVRQGGSLLIGADEERRGSVKKTGLNDIIQPFGMELTEDITPYLHNRGAIAKKGVINREDRELPYSGGRAVKGGTPFSYILDEKGPTELAHGAYVETPAGARVIVLAETMASLFLGAPGGVRFKEAAQDATIYWGKDSRIFNEEIISWLTEPSRASGIDGRGGD